MSDEWMEQSWHHLLFMHWPLAPDELQSRLPPTLEVDTHHGRAYVGLVAFTMTGVRPRGWPKIPPLTSLHEVNVRTYVKRGDQRGVLFFSLDAASPVAVSGARVAYGLPYFPATMRMGVTPRGGEHVEHRAWMPESLARAEATRLTYSSQRWRSKLAHVSLEWEPQGFAEPSQEGTLQHFLVERYTLFAQRGSRLYQGTVRHPPYAVSKVKLLRWEESLLAASGIPRPGVPPLVHASPGVDVFVPALRRVI
jgi:uncharacterized protein